MASMSPGGGRRIDPGTMLKALVAIDLAKPAAATRLVGLARDLLPVSAYTFDLVYVVDQPAPAFMSADLSERLRQTAPRREQEAKTELDRIRTQYALRGQAFIIEDPDLAHALLERARRYDVLVVGARDGRSVGWFASTTPQRLVRTAQVPLLTIPMGSDPKPPSKPKP